MQPTFFINHGGGPLFQKPGSMRPAWHELEAYLATLGGRLPRRPDAILGVSGHRDEPLPTVSPLRDESVVIVGSGQRHHNMRGFFDGRRTDPGAEASDDWLRMTLADAERRTRAPERRDKATGVRGAQPGEDHFAPPMIAAGAADGEPGRTDFHGQVPGKPISGFRFG